MKLSRIVFSILVGSLLFGGQIEVFAAKPRAKTTQQTTKGKPKTTVKNAGAGKAPKSGKATKLSKATKASTKAGRKAVVQAQRSKSKRSAARSRSARRLKSNPRLTSAMREQKRIGDSIRLQSGGAIPVPAQAPKSVASDEPVLNRFRRGDTSLPDIAISRMYYAQTPTQEDLKFSRQIESSTDRLIMAHRYADALAEVKRGLWRCPMSMPLLQYACDLTQHLGQDAQSSIYLWKLAAVMRAVASSGDGTSAEKAYRVAEDRDAEIFESLWLDTDEDQLIGQTDKEISGTRYILYNIAQPKGKTISRYYRPSAPASQSDLIKESQAISVKK